MRIVIENKLITNIPVLELYNAEQKGKIPLVLVLHGLERSKESNLNDAYKLAKEGFFAVVFDAPCHGELETEEFKRYDNMEKSGKAFEISLDTADFIDTIIEYYKESNMADYSKIGLMGISMGGNSIYNYISKRRKANIKAAVPIIATPAWEYTVKTYIDSKPEIFDFVPREEIMKRIAFIEKIQPYGYMENVKDLPLLMLNGDIDYKIPIRGVREFHSELLKVYSDTSKLQFVEYKDCGHLINPEMINRAVSWFKKYLLEE